MDAEIRAIFEESLGRFCSDQYSHAQWRMYADNPDRYNTGLWQEMADLGWLGLIRESDGLGGTLTDLLPVFIAAGKALWREPLLGVLAESAGVLMVCPESGKTGEVLDAIAAGEARPVFAHREDNTGWQIGPVVTSAVKVKDDYVLSGRKSYVVAAESCSTMIVTATLEESGELGCFLVDRQAPGVTLDSFRTIDDVQASRVTLADAPGRLLVTGQHAVTHARQRLAVLAAAQAVGVMQAVNQATVEYLKNRKQFGRPLSSFQALQHRLVEMFILQQETQALVSAAARACDDQSDEAESLLLALRVKAARAGKYVTQQAIQMHGGMGVTAELPIGDYYKRVLMLEGLCGSADWALEQLAAA